MKKLFISMLAVAALASCSQEDVIVADKGELIGFNSFVENSTRAADPSYTTTGTNPNLTSFNVYGAVNGVNIFNGNTVSKGDEDYGEAWSMAADAPKQYWINGANYEFVAVVDGNKKDANNNVITATTVNTSGIPSSITYNSDGATDLLCARVVRNNNTDTSVVPFNFSHLLSKVNFTVTNEDKGATGYSFVVKNIKFAGNVAGVYNVATAAWDDKQFTTGDTALGNERTVNSATVKDIVVPTSADNVELNTEVLFLPGTYNISFTVDILYNDVVITSTKYPATGTYTQELKQNNAYNFNVNVSVGDEITFTATALPDWNTDLDNDKVDDDDITLQ